MQNQTLQWLPLSQSEGAYKFQVQGLSFNNHLMAGSDEFSLGVVDSGTTFTYMPFKLFNMVRAHFEWFCSNDPQTLCKGKMKKLDGDSSICFEYDEDVFAEGPKFYFMSYPLLQLLVTDVNGDKTTLKWYPSEYLYRYNQDSYCLAVEQYNRPTEILLGGTFMRQNAFVFDVEANRVGVVRARCNNDPN